MAELALPAAPAPIWPIWAVTLTAGSYTSTHEYTAPTRSKARYDAWLSVSDAWEISFKDFQRQTTVRRCDAPRVDGYDYVRRTYGVDARIGRRVRLRNEGPGYDGREGVITYPNRSSTAYVYVLLDGGKRPSIVHPNSVELISEAPAAPAAHPGVAAPEILF